MRTDPERIREVEEEHERVQRQRRERPKRGFGDVLESAPVWHGEEDEEDAAPDPRRARAKAEIEDEAVADVAEPEASASAPAPVALDENPDSHERNVPRVPPDPRMAQLNRMLDSGAGAAKKEDKSRGRS